MLFIADSSIFREIFPTGSLLVTGLRLLPVDGPYPLYLCAFMLFITDSSISMGIFKFPNTVGSPEKHSN